MWTTTTRTTVLSTETMTSKVLYNQKGSKTKKNGINNIIKINGKNQNMKNNKSIGKKEKIRVVPTITLPWDKKNNMNNNKYYEKNEKKKNNTNSERKQNRKSINDTKKK